MTTALASHIINTSRASSASMAPMTTMTNTVLMSSLKVQVTDANVDYVGSVTIDSQFCDHLGWHDRQLVQIRNSRTGVDLWTYVIYGTRSTGVKPGTLCLNGAAAHLVTVGDTVEVYAWASVTMMPSSSTTVDSASRVLQAQRQAAVRRWDATVDGFNPPAATNLADESISYWTSNEINASVEIAVGKVHRPRISDVLFDNSDGGNENGAGPCVTMDSAWIEEAGLVEGQSVHVVNINTGQRDVLLLRTTSTRKACIITMGQPATHVAPYGSRAGYSKGDIIIVMAYATVPYKELFARNGDSKIPKMRISFPVEKQHPVTAVVKTTDNAADTLNTSWSYTTRIVWNEAKLAAGLVKLLDLTRPGLRILDCSCGNAFPAVYLIRDHLTKNGNDEHIQLCLSDGSDLVCRRARERLSQELSDDHGVDVRCVRWDDLAAEYGKQAFDVIICRGNSLPYVGGDWNEPEESTTASASKSSKAADGYRALHASARGIFEALAPGGKLYVDCVKASAANGAVMKKEGTVPDGSCAKVQLEWDFQVDEEQRARHWTSKTTVEEENKAPLTFNNKVTALLVREQELRSVLSYVGFGVVEPCVCDGEDVYQPFLVSKPAVEIGYYDRQVDRYRRVWNDNGKILWGLFEEASPKVLTPEWAEMSKTAGKGALVGQNLAMQAYMVSKLDPIAKRSNGVERILDVGCGTGRSTLDLGMEFPKAACVGCDPSGVSVAQGESRAKAQGIGDRVTFFHGTVQELVAADSGSSPKFSAAWSEAALCHAPPLDRAGAMESIANQLEEGGMFVLNDAVAGYAPVSAAAQLHFYERLHYTDLWTPQVYLQVLESCGLHVVEMVDLSEHQAASYTALAREAERAAAESNGDEEARQTFATLAVDYDISAAASLRGELGWHLFVCKKVQKQF